LATRRERARLLKLEESARLEFQELVNREKDEGRKYSQLVRLARRRLLFASERRRAFEKEQENQESDQREQKRCLSLREVEALETQLRRLDRLYSKRVHVRTLELLASRGITSPNWPQFILEYRKEQRAAEAELDVERARLDSEIQTGRYQLQTSTEEPSEARNEQSQE